MNGARNTKSHDFELVSMPITPTAQGGAKEIDLDSMAHRRKLLIDNLADEASEIEVSSPDLNNKGVKTAQAFPSGQRSLSAYSLPSKSSGHANAEPPIDESGIVLTSGRQHSMADQV